MGRYTEKILPAKLAEIRKALKHYAHVRYTVDGQPHETTVEWYGYPPSWPKLTGEQRVEWWRQHCVRQFAMPLHAQLTGITIKCWGVGL